MKSWVSILAAAAILVLAAPVGYSAISGVPGEPTSGRSTAVQTAPSKLVKATPTSKAQAAKIKQLTAKNKALAAKNAALASSVSTLQARVDYLEGLNRPQPQPQLPIVVDNDDDCLSYVVCTPEQDCRIWGNSCHLAPAPTVEPSITEPPAESTTSEPATDSPAGGSESTASTPTSSSGLECASLVDPAMSIDYPSAYDWSC